MKISLKITTKVISTEGSCIAIQKEAPISQDKCPDSNVVCRGHKFPI